MNRASHPSSRHTIGAIAYLTHSAKLSQPHLKAEGTDMAIFYYFLIVFKGECKIYMAETMGLEPTTSGVTGQRYNQLNHASDGGPGGGRMWVATLHISHYFSLRLSKNRERGFALKLIRYSCRPSTYKYNKVTHIYQILLYLMRNVVFIFRVPLMRGVPSSGP